MPPKDDELDIASWLRKLGLQRYERAFRDNDIDAEILPKLTADDLKDIGIVVVGHRRKLLEAIAVLAETTSVLQAKPRAQVDGTPRVGATQAERRQLIIMFVDLVGSTELSTRLAIFSFIEGFYNPLRRHLGLGYLSPIDYERRFEQQAVDPGTGQHAVLLTAVKARPRNHVGSRSVDDPAGLDRRSAGRPDHSAGRDERRATAEQKKMTTQQEDNMIPTTLH